MSVFGRKSRVRAFVVFVSWWTVALPLHHGNAEAGQWTRASVSVPRPQFMPPSHDWSPHFLTLVHDSNRRVTLGIGGHANPFLGYLAVSEYNGTSWVSRYEGSAANTPSFRSIGNAVFDHHRNVTIIFGGWIGNTQNALNELWEYNGNTWTQRTWTGPGPAKSVNVPMCFDPLRGRTITLTHSATAGTWETWEWTGSAWERGPDLVGVNDGSLTQMVFDASRNRAFVYTTFLGGGFETTYEYTPGPTAAQGVWHHVPISGAPFEAKYGVSLAYDPYQRRIIRHGGRAFGNIYSYLDATYAWNPVQSRWNLIAALPDGGRGGAGLCFDTRRVMMVLYGGVRVWVENGSTVRNTTYSDTWEFVDNLPGETWVDFSHLGAELGTPQQPWNSVAEALIHAPSGGTIILKSGASPVTLRSSDFRTAPVVLKAWDGSAIVGN